MQRGMPLKLTACAQTHTTKIPHSQRNLFVGALIRDPIAIAIIALARHLHMARVATCARARERGGCATDCRLFVRHASFCSFVRSCVESLGFSNDRKVHADCAGAHVQCQIGLRQRSASRFGHTASAMTKHLFFPAPLAIKNDRTTLFTALCPPRGPSYHASLVFSSLSCDRDRPASACY
jgi:hypothetical protein